MNNPAEHFEPLRRDHAEWLRDTYANITRFIGRDGVSVTHGRDTITVAATDEEAGESIPRPVPDFRHQGGLLSATQLNRIIDIYNAARRMIGSGLAVIKTELAFVFTPESDGSGGAYFPELEHVRPADPRTTIFRPAIMAPLVTLALAWQNAIATDTLTLTKARQNYILEGTASSTACLFIEDWESQPRTGLGISLLVNWDLLFPPGNNVDVLGPGGFDPLPGNGKYIDLVGTTTLYAWARAKIQTKSQIILQAGKSYTFKYVLAGDNRGGGGTQTVNAKFHTVDATHVMDTADPATTYTHTVTGPHTGYITFENTATTNPLDLSKGPCLLYVSVCPA